MPDIYREALEKLCKWRSIFAGWQLGTRVDTDPECQAVRDHREVTMCLRAEVNMLTRILLEKGVVTQAEVQRIVAEEAEYLSASYERKFPGMKATAYVIEMGITYLTPARN